MPKVFISYSWTSPAHQAAVKEWAERLIADGIEVVLDIYDLREGHDKFAFMERMVTDPSVTHVLMFCDKGYAEKADKRKAGVGTESQIMSKEVYEKVEQSKFIPVVCELNEEGNPYLPAFLGSRIWIDFSSPEAVNQNWEQLIRLLYGKPLHVKPELGKAPAYLRDEGVPASPAISKFIPFKQAILQGKPGLGLYRQDFLNACLEYADSLRVRQKPTVENLGEKVLADCTQLKLVRDHIIDWVVLEGAAAPSEAFQEALLRYLENMLELKSRPREVSAWNDAWFEAHRLFVYETFLYIVAALLNIGAYGVLREVFTSHYLLPETDSYGHRIFGNFSQFYGYSETLQSVLAAPGRKLISPAAELVKRQADRSDIPFASIMEADLLVLLMALIEPSVDRWYPQTLLYQSSGNGFPFFVRAIQHKGFVKLAVITGINDASQLRSAVIAGRERLHMDNWTDFNFFANRSIVEHLNLEKLDTLK